MAAVLLMMTDSAFAQYASTECGDLENAFGPFDYADPANAVPQGNEPESKLHLVERAHFTADVENLVRGFTSFTALPDLEYTLRAFPNHHRALNSIANYHIKNNAKKIGLYSIDCWFDRAMRFRPDDAVVRLIYAIYLARTDQKKSALEQYQTALELQPDSAETHYNIGLLYFDMQKYDLAFEHAEMAYDLGYPLPGLRKRLVKVGAWKRKPEEE